MAMVTRAKIPLIRAVIVFAAFCGMTLLWIASEGILPESNLSSAIRGMVCVTLFILTLDISMQLSEPGRLQSSAPGDDESLSSSVSNQHEAERTSDQNKDSKSQKELETTRNLASIDDQVLDSVAAGLEAERRDEELWAKLLITVDGAEARKEAIGIRLGAKRLQRKAEEKRLKAAQRRSNADASWRATRNTLITR